MPDIFINNLHKSFYNKPVVDSLSLKINQGEIVTILGNSGCGKTTTLRLIAGFEYPDNGSVKIGDKILCDKNNWIEPENRGVAMVFQDYVLFPHLNIQQNIQFGLKDKSDQDLQEVLKLVNLQGCEKRFPNEISGGQQQRTAIARALIRRPSIILLDEPFSNIDEELKNTIRVQIKQILNKAKVTTILVTHDQKDALAISNKIAVMKNGKIIQYDTPQNIFLKPKSEFVAKFVSKANIITGTVVDKNLLDTPIGILAIPQGVYKTGDKLKIALRPESFKSDPQAKIKGVIQNIIYMGSYIEADLIINKHKLKIHLDHFYNINKTKIAVSLKESDVVVLN